MVRLRFVFKFIFKFIAGIQLVFLLLGNYAFCGLRIHDYSLKLVSFIHTNQGASESRYVALFKKFAESIYPEFYSYKIKEWKKQGRDTEVEFKVLAMDLRKNSKSIESAAKQIHMNLADGMKSFQKVLTDFKPDIDVYFFPCSWGGRRWYSNHC